eukprot:TRINITY_DN106364_c0_g1_i1.p1 TRINITY_DN106364_c0_g1~~TRINITY_DN106364_c0_g1_i1.p1  ORF type:complete len:110 (-),score=29.93 TRINITY_DN106364_c0_g1_i1:274-603(-)
MDEEFFGQGMGTADAESRPSEVAKSTQALDTAEMTDELPTCSWPPERIQSFFEKRIGHADTCFKAMLDMDVSELEDLQGIADSIKKGCASKEAQSVALEWSVRIANVIA